MERGIFPYYSSDTLSSYSSPGPVTSRSASNDSVKSDALSLSSNTSRFSASFKFVNFFNLFDVSYSEKIKSAAQLFNNMFNSKEKDEHIKQSTKDTFIDI